MRLRKLLVPAVVVALGVSACGGDDSTDEPSAGGDEVTSEPEDADGAVDPEPSEDPGSFEESTDEAETGADEEEVDTVELFTAIADATVAEGSYEFEATRGTDTTAAGAIQVGSSLDESNMRITSQRDGVEATVLIVDGQNFIEMAEDVDTDHPFYGSWVTIDPECDDPGDQWMLIVDARGPDHASAMDDISSLSDQLADLTENADMVTVTQAGTAEIDGVATTEYHINDIAGFTDSVDETFTELSYSMWVGDDDLIRRVVTDDGRVTTEMNYSNYGVEVDAEAPPADKVNVSSWDCRGN